MISAGGRFGLVFVNIFNEFIFLEWFFYAAVDNTS